jgi:hypothetical protein
MSTPLSLVDPVYKASMDARPSNYLVNHVSWEKPSNQINWTGLKVIRSTTGYPQDPGDGEEIYSAASDDVILLVDSVNSTTGAITSVSVLKIGAASGVAVTSASPVSVKADLGSPTTGGKGRLAVLSLSSGGVVTINSAGGGYSVGDVLRISGDYSFNGSKLPGVTSTAQLGVTNVFHIYDKGVTPATTVNPGYGVTGTDLNVNKYYYSLFIYYVKTPSASTIAAVTPNTSVYWKKVGEVSSSVVRKSSVRDTKSVLLDHLPVMYKVDDKGAYNSDLDAFLSLFAFHIDTYLAKLSDVYNMTNVNTADEVLLKEFLNQFGVDSGSIPNITQARALLKNIVRAYQTGGTVPGLQAYLEAYTGLLVKEKDGKNALLDYNTSSFVETIGNWYPSVEADYVNSYDSTTGAYTEVLYGYPTSGMHNISMGSMSTTNIDPYMTVLSDLAYTGTYSTSTINPVYNARATVSTAASGTKTIVVDDTSKLAVGYKPLVISGTGSFPTGTVITQIVNTTTFKINKALASNISVGAVITVSRNLTSSMLSLRASATGNPVKFYSGRRKTNLYYSGTTSSGGYGITQTLRAAPCTVKVGDYITAPEITASNVKVTAVDYTTGIVVIDKDIQTDISNAGTFITAYLSQSPDKVTEGSVDTVPISGNTPYTFSMNFNANGGTALQTQVDLTWFNATGNVISTSSVVASAPASTTTWYPTSVSAISPSLAAYVAPSFAVGTSGAGVSSTVSYYADAAMLSKPVKASHYSKSDSLITITTTEPHNFYPGNLAAVKLSSTTAYDTLGTSLTLTNLSASTPSGSVRYTAANSLIVGQYVTISGIGTTAGYNGTFRVTAATTTTFTVVNPTTGGFTTTNAKVTTVPYITDVTQDPLNKLYTFTYSNPQVTTAGTANDADSGYASSIPMYTNGTTPRVVFEDARTVKLNIIGSRINLCANPNFESSTTGWSAVGSTLSTSTTNKYVGSQSMSISLNSSASANSGADFVSLPSSSTSVGYSIPVTAGSSYALSAYAIRSSGDASPTMVANIIWYDSSGTSISTSSGLGTAINSTTWTRVSVVGTAPVTAVSARLQFFRAEATTNATVILLDAVLMEQSELVNRYFDGSFDGFSYDVSRDSMWAGLANLSHSHLYPGRVEKQGTIDKQLTEVIYYA